MPRAAETCWKFKGQESHGRKILQVQANLGRSRVIRSGMGETQILQTRGFTLHEGSSRDRMPGSGYLIAERITWLRFQQY
jgi:hypothetical protein